LPNFTIVFFKIEKVKPVYKLKDIEEDLNGIVYKDELSPYNKTEHITYKIKTVVCMRTIKGKKLVLYKYKGWPDKFNEWLSTEDVLRSFTK